MHEPEERLDIIRADLKFTAMKIRFVTRYDFEGLFPGFLSVGVEQPGRKRGALSSMCTRVGNNEVTNKP